MTKTQKVLEHDILNNLSNEIEYALEKLETRVPWEDLEKKGLQWNKNILYDKILMFGMSQEELRFTSKVSILKGGRV